MKWARNDRGGRRRVAATAAAHRRVGARRCGRAGSAGSTAALHRREDREPADAAGLRPARPERSARQPAPERGKLMLLTFLYTECHDVCPLVAGNLNTALRHLGPARKDVRVLAVSVDPVGDTRRAVRRFVSSHQLLPEFRYLIGSDAALRPVWEAYNVSSVRRKAGDVDHDALHAPRRPQRQGPRDLRRDRASRRGRARPAPPPRLSYSPQNASNAGGSVGSASTCRQRPSRRPISSTWSMSSSRPRREPRAR